MWKDSKYEDYVVISMDIEDLPENNTELYTLFPSLKEDKKNCDKDDTVTFYLKNSIEGKSDEEIAIYFKEEEQILSYEGVFLFSEYSSDRKDHDIKSEEEAKEYFSMNNYGYGLLVVIIRKEN